MSAIVTVAGLRCISARFVFPYVGVWFADLDVDPDEVHEVTALISAAGAPVPVTVGLPPTKTLLGVVDPLASGVFGQTSRVRVIGGQGGWQKSVPAQHFSSPAGLTTSVVYTATGALVKEVVTVINPELLGTDYVRTAGPASRILQDESWWVDPITGTTFVGPRPPALPDTSLEVKAWDPTTKAAEVHCDTLVLPGTPLVDLRIGESPVTVRDVEQVFDAGGSVATCWTSTNTVSRLRAALQTMVREFAKTGFVKVARYRFVSDATGPTKVALQAVDRDPLTQMGAPYPDLLPLTTWTGLPGASADMPPGLEVLVGFVDGDPTKPVVLGYSTLAPPLTTTIDATVALNLGVLAPLITIGGVGAQLLATAPGLAALISALATFAGAASTATTAAQIATAAGTLQTALGSLPPVATTKTKAV